MVRDDRSTDAEDAAAAVELATSLLATARDLEPRSSRRRARRLARLLDDPRSMAFSLALTDEVARITDPTRAARRLADLVAAGGAPTFLGALDRLALHVGVAAAHVAPRLVTTAVGRRLRHEAAGVVLPAEEPAFTRYVARRRASGTKLNVNLLGEAILGDRRGAAAARRGAGPRRAPRRRLRVGQGLVDLCASSTSLAFDAVGRRGSPSACASCTCAAPGPTPRMFVNLDMEEYRDLDADRGGLHAACSTSPSLARLDAGIVLQAYLPDSHAALDRLATWAVPAPRARRRATSRCGS